MCVKTRIVYGLTDSRYDIAIDAGLALRKKERNKQTNSQQIGLIFVFVVDRDQSRNENNGKQYIQQIIFFLRFCNLKWIVSFDVMKLNNGNTVYANVFWFTVCV